MKSEAGPGCRSNHHGSASACPSTTKSPSCGRRSNPSWPQDFADFELIICDNASDDATPEISREYAALDPRVRYYRNEKNVGGTENFNYALQLAAGKYFMWAAGHDLWAPTYLSRCLEVLESDESVVACNSITQWVSRDGKERGSFERQFDTRRYGLLVRGNIALWQVSPFSGYSLIRTSVIRQNRLTMRRVIAPDYLFGLELALVGPTAIVPELLFFMRDNRGENSKAIKDAKAVGAFLERLYPRGTSPLGRFKMAKYMVEEMRAIRRARMSTWQRMMLCVSIPPTYLIEFYRFVPQRLRRPVRGWLGHFLKPPQKPVDARSR